MEEYAPPSWRIVPSETGGLQGFGLRDLRFRV